MYRTIVAGILSITSSFWMAVDSEGGKTSDVKSVVVQETTTTSTTVVTVRPPSVLDELIGHTIPDIGYVFQRGQCETGMNWRNGGKFSGLTGTYRGTFQQWGGYEEFGVVNASDAPREVQILIWYRVHYLGYNSPTKGFIPSAGQLINNCSRYAEKHYNGDTPMVLVTQDTVDLWRVLIANTGRG